MPRYRECPICGAHLDPGETCDCQAPEQAPAPKPEVQTFEGREVFTSDTFTYEGAKIGDLVTQEVVDDAMDCLPPACMRASCSQMGEPHSHRQDPDTGRWRPTYATFRRIAGEWPHGIYEFCGYCFAGETVERGREPVYC